MTDPLHAGELLMVEVDGTTLTPATARFLADHHIRGVCLFRKNVADAEQTARLVRDLRDVMGEHALIGIDQEGGAVLRATFLPQAPSAMGLGAVGDERLAFDVGAAVGRGLISLGINWNFAPVLDLNNNPANPVIGERSFGADPAQATRLAAAWMRGSLAAGVATCAKHFPGHGDTHTDSHQAMPVVDKAEADLARYEFYPFRELATELPALMSAHILYPALDPLLPATLSRPLLTGLLRERWRYRGVIVTDGMNMKAIRETWGQAEGSVLALAAGADLSLVLAHRDEMQATLRAIDQARVAGRLTEADLLASRDRLRALASRFPATARPYPVAQRALDDTLFAEAWRRGLTTVGTPHRPTPGTPVRVVVQDDVPGDGIAEPGLSADRLIEALARHFPVEPVVYRDRAEIDWNRLPQDGRFTVLASNARQRYTERERASWRPDLHLVLWNPYQVLDLPTPALVTFGFTPDALVAASDWLAGRLPAPGCFPTPLAPTPADALPA